MKQLKMMTCITGKESNLGFISQRDLPRDDKISRETLNQSGQQKSSQVPQPTTHNPNPIHFPKSGGDPVYRKAPLRTFCSLQNECMGISLVFKCSI